MKQISTNNNPLSSTKSKIEKIFKWKLALPIIVLIFFGSIFLIRTQFFDNLHRIEKNSQLNSLTMQSIANSILTDQPKVQKPEIDSLKISIEKNLLIKQPDSTDENVKNEKQKYKEYITEIKQIVKTQDPSIALEKLIADFPFNRTVQQNCHSITHIIGSAALEKYDYDANKVISFNKKAVCGGGFIHGIIAHFVEKSQNPEVEIFNICNSFSDECVHGIGHGLMIITTNNIPKSKKMCQNFTLENQVLFCLSGVYMENFDSENSDEDQRPYLDKANPANICVDSGLLSEVACYYYVGRYIADNSVNNNRILIKCSIDSPENTQKCINGVGSAIARKNIMDSTIIEQVCNQFYEFQKNCAAGALDYYGMIFGSNPKLEIDFCNSQSTSLAQEVCKNFN